MGVTTPRNVQSLLLAKLGDFEVQLNNLPKPTLYLERLFTYY